MATTRKTKGPGKGARKPRSLKKPRAGTRSKQAASGIEIKITSFPSAVKALLGRPNIERLRPSRIEPDQFKLERMGALLESLGNPQADLCAIHVAGTIGKGSTVAMIDAMLRGCGRTTGTFTSPHLMDIRERITINGEPVSRPAFTDLAQRVAAAAGMVDSEVSYFETLTAMSLLHFAEQAVDVAIVEVGLGGRLDATNLLKPRSTLITRIDLDHTHLLGHTLAEIAREKAGIFKPGASALSVPQDAKVEAVLREVAEEVGSPLRIIGRDIEYSSRFCVTEDLGAHMRICLLGECNQYMHLPVPLAGEHQADNCALALAALDIMDDTGTAFDESSVFRGLAMTRNPGRMDMVWDRPRILVDGAHNPASMQALMRNVGSHVSFDSMICVFGCNVDKDIDAMLNMVAMGGDKIIFTKASDQPRAAEPEDLAKRFADARGRVCQTADNVREALEIASRASSREDLICVTGSFYLVGEAMCYLNELRAKQG